MPTRTRVVVDGSNLATEGRTEPSLAQLDEAVSEFQREFPDAEITVVVDSTFGYRIHESERKTFEEAELAGEIVSPPAGAIGRGDAFVLRIADKVGAIVLSNDSFQEFHGEHEWLFDKDRLIGGKPVPGIGWIFSPRVPVRGPRSRQAVRVVKQARKVVEKKPARSSRARPKVVEQAIKAATDEAVEPAGDGETRNRRRRRGGSTPPTEPVNEPLTFVTFIAEHHPGTAVTGEVESFSSHGAFIRVGMARCYLPLTEMGDPPPAAARQMLSKGEQRRFLVKAFDPPRRGIELSLLNVPAEDAAPPQKAGGRRRAAAGPAKAAASRKTAPAPRKVAVKKAAPAPRKAAVKKAAPAPRKAAVKKAASAPRKAAVKKAASVKKAAAAPNQAVAPKKAATTKDVRANKKKAAPKKSTATKKAAKKRL